MKLWGGRYEVEPDEAMERLNASIGFDVRLWEADIEGSRAWAEGLARAGVLTDAELAAILTGLDQVADELERDALELQASDEDIHTAVERRLHEVAGEVAGKLHSGRSRNDQVATDERLYLKREIDHLDRALRGVQEALLTRAETDIDAILPGYTHLQRAQPIRFSHLLLSYFWMLDRDRARLRDLRVRVDVLPLGSGALAGHSLGVDREFLAKRLGFARTTENSVDAVSDRDHVLEVLAAAAILGVHLSRIAEDLIIYCSSEHGFVRLDPRYTTGSSLMPQKANPDALELCRGKAGRLVGNLVTLLTVVKGLPSTYNKDLQEDKEPLFDTLDSLRLVLPVLREVIGTLTPVPESMLEAIDDSMLATDLSEALVAKGVPFRQAHHLVGQVVVEAEKRGLALGQLSAEALAAISEQLPTGEEYQRLFDRAAAVDRKRARGGTGRAAVEAQLAEARNRLEQPG